MAHHRMSQGEFDFLVRLAPELGTRSKDDSNNQDSC